MINNDLRQKHAKSLAERVDVSLDEHLWSPHDWQRFREILLRHFTGVEPAKEFDVSDLEEYQADRAVQDPANAREWMLAAKREIERLRSHLKENLKLAEALLKRQ